MDNPVSYIFGKITDKVIDDPTKAWLTVGTMFTGISGLLLYLEELPNAYKFILLLATPAIFMGFYTLWLFAGEKWFLSRRIRAIKSGVNRIFEGHNDAGYLTGWVATKWFVTSGNDPEFSEQENLTRFLLAETSGRLKVFKMQDSSTQFIAQKEMERWLISCHQVSIPKAWYS